VSHHTQRRGQPVRRTKTVGKPTRELSPCRDRKISLIFSASGSCRDGLHLAYFFRRCLALWRRRLSGYLASSASSVFFGTLAVAELLLAGGDVEQRVGRLGVRRPLAADDALGLDRPLAVTQA
jgi:hypothetical protein